MDHMNPDVPRGAAALPGAGKVLPWPFGEQRRCSHEKQGEFQPQALSSSSPDHKQVCITLRIQEQRKAGLL